MKFPRDARPELLVGDAPQYPELHNPYLDLQDREHPLLVSCDGRALVVLPVEVDEGDVEGPVPVKAVVAARKAARRSAEPEIFCAAETVTVHPTDETFPRPVLGRSLPDWRQVVLTARDEGKQTVRVMFDVGILSRMVRVTNGGLFFCTLEFAVDADGRCSTDGTPLRVEIDKAPSGTRAVLMPAHNDTFAPAVERGTPEVPAPRRHRLKWIETCADCEHKPHDGEVCKAKDCGCEALTACKAIEAGGQA